MNEACAIIQQAADEDANVIFGLVQDKEMRDQVKISVIATGFEPPSASASLGRREPAAAPAQPERSRSREFVRSVPEPVVPEDSGYGVNQLNLRDPREDVFDIPTFLRRQMD